MVSTDGFGRLKPAPTYDSGVPSHMLAAFPPTPKATARSRPSSLESSSERRRKAAQDARLKRCPTLVSAEAA
jgi:hypothetical protein